MDYRILVLAVIAVIAVGLIVPLAIAAKGGTPRGLAACKDGIDNDGDNYIDWPDDPGCSNKNDNTETNPAIECDDGIDNDGDGDTDMADGGCSSPTDNDETNCGDGVCEGPETQGNCPADCGYPDSCSDTDGGNFITIFGTASGYLNNSWYSDPDSCTDASNVMEYYCSGAYKQSQQQSCGTDGYTGGNYCMGGDVYRDYTNYYCSSGACGSNTSAVLQQDCVTGQYCSSGACYWNDSCSDTDGGLVVNIQGTVYGYSSGSPYSITDACNSTFVYEYYCSGDEWSISPFNCAGGNYTTCSSGACV